MSSGSGAKCTHLRVTLLSCKAIFGTPGLLGGPGHFLMDSGLSKGSDPFEFCTALDIIPFDKRVFTPDYRSTVERL